MLSKGDRLRIKVTSTIAVLILLAAVTSAGSQQRKTNLEDFKSELMPKVGKRVTVEGVLKWGKIGWLVAFKEWGIYLKSSDTVKMNQLNRLNGQTIKATGTLRYFPPPPPASSTDVAATLPEHFYFDVDEARVVSVNPPRSSVSTPRAKHAGTTPSPLSSRPPVEMKFRQMRFGKPPLVYLSLDTVLRNSRTEPRWFLLPSNLDAAAAPLAAKGGIDKVEVFAPRGEGRVLVGHFFGTGGFRALLLPAGAEVRLRLFPISFWGELPDRLRVEVVIAKRLQIGGEDAEAWFKVNPTSSLKADIAERVDDWTRSVSSRSTPDGREVATFIEEDSRFDVQVSLNEKNKKSGARR